MGADEMGPRNEDELLPYVAAFLADFNGRAVSDNTMFNWCYTAAALNDPRGSYNAQRGYDEVVRKWLEARFLHETDASGNVWWRERAA